MDVRNISTWPRGRPRDLSPSPMTMRRPPFFQHLPPRSPSLLEAYTLVQGLVRHKSNCELPSKFFHTCRNWDCRSPNLAPTCKTLHLTSFAVASLRARSDLTTSASDGAATRPTTKIAAPSPFTAYFRMPTCQAGRRQAILKSTLGPCPQSRNRRRGIK